VPQRDDPFTCAYEDLTDRYGEKELLDALPARSGTGKMLLKSPRFRNARRIEVRNEQMLDRAGFRGRVVGADFVRGMLALGRDKSPRLEPLRLQPIWMGCALRCPKTWF